MHFQETIVFIHRKCSQNRYWGISCRLQSPNASSKHSQAEQPPSPSRQNRVTTPSSKCPSHSTSSSVVGCNAQLWVVGRSIQPFISPIQSLNLIQPSCRQCFQSSNQLVRLATIGTSIPSGVRAVRVQVFNCSALRSNRPSIQFSSSRPELTNPIFLVQSSYSSARGMLRRIFISRLIRLRRAI